MSSEPPLADVCELIVDCPHKTAPETAEAYAYAVGTKAVSDGRIDFKQSRPVSKETYRAWVARAVPHTGDLILCREAPVGPVALVPEDPRICLGQRTVLLRPDRAVANPRYLMYALLEPGTQEALRALSEGSTVAHLNVSDVRAFRVALPSLAEQERIAAILGVIDDKVDSNTRLIRLLDRTATTFFSGRVVVALGYDRCVESKLGPIPAGWRVACLGELGVVRGGGTPSSKVPSYWDPAEIAWATPSDMTSLRAPVIWDTSRKISTAGLNKSSANLLPPGTVLYTSRATLGHVAVARADMATNQGFITVEPAAHYSPEFVLMTLRARNNAIISKANGSTFLEVNKTNFKDVPFIDPPLAVRREVDEVLGPMFAKIESLDREIRDLQELRALLLPRLISGTLAVAADDLVVDPAETAPALVA